MYKKALQTIAAGAVLTASAIAGNGASATESFRQPVSLGAAEATERILQEAEHNQTIMFGEAHSYSQPEEYVASLLPLLKQKGFEYFAIEWDMSYPWAKYVIDYALGKDVDLDKTLSDDPYNTIGSWIEIAKDSGNILVLEAAAKAGMKIVPYDVRLDYNLENQVEAWTARDQEAFENVMEQIFEDDPDAKVVFFTGQFHISEKPNTMPGWYLEGKGYTIPLGVYVNAYTGGKNLSVRLVSPGEQDMWEGWAKDHGYDSIDDVIRMVIPAYDLEVQLP